MLVPALVRMMIMLEQPGTWAPDELAEFLSRTAIRGMLATAPSVTGA